MSINRIIVAFGAILFSITTFSQITTVTNGLVAEYTFNNGDATADFGGINGTVNNATTTADRFGCPDHAYEFELNNESLISLGDNFDATTSTPDSTWSVSIWFKMDDLDNDYEPLFNKFSHSACGVDERQFILRMSADNELEFTYNMGSVWTDYAIARSSTIISDKDWHHVVAVYDGSIDTGGGVDRVTMYLDNQLQTLSLAGSSGPLANITAGSAHLGIGARLNEVGDYCPITGQDHLWDGALDDIRLYNRGLSTNEVSILFNETESCGVGIKEDIVMNGITFSLFPNPTIERLNIKVGSSFEELSYEVSIFDLSGKKIMESNHSTNHIQIDIEDLSPATYIIWLKHLPTGEASSLRFIKKN